MLKANELRIGNFVYPVFDKNQPHEPEILIVKQITGFGELAGVLVSKITGDTNFIHSLPEIGIRSIPLTEEWLLKFGFENGKFKRVRLQKLNTEDWFIEYCTMISGVDSWIRVGIFTEYKYVHQLQNLYFALTGEELKIHQEVV